MVNYDTPRHHVNFVQTDFWYSSSFGVTWPSKLCCYEESTPLFIYHILLLWWCCYCYLSGFCVGRV